MQQRVICSDWLRPKAHPKSAWYKPGSSYVQHKCVSDFGGCFPVNYIIYYFIISYEMTEMPPINEYIALQ